MKVKPIILTLALIGLGYLVYQRISADQPDANKPKGPRTVQVAGLVIQPEPFNPLLQLTGSLEGYESLAVRSEIAGVIERIAFTEGTTVNKGAVLVQLRSADLKAQLAQARAKEALAKENHRRADLLLAKEAISREEYEVAFTEFKAAQAYTQQLVAQLDKTQIRAPFSGKAGLKQVEVGAFVSNQDIIVQLVNATKIKLRFTVPEKYAQQVKLGDEVQFTVNQKDYRAKIYALEPALDDATRSLAVNAELLNPNAELIPGSFANVQLAVDALPSAILVPSDAIIPIQGGKQVYVYQNGKAVARKVTTGTRTSEKIEITEGLKLGDTLITSGAFQLKPGNPVKIAI